MRNRKATSLPEARFWWEVMPALPEGPQAREHYVLRRIWGDHTMNTEAKGRGYYRWGSEDNITPALFQLWAIFDDPAALAGLATAAGMPAQDLSSVRWAYACEEKIARGSYQGVTGSFVIPDIVLHLEDARGQAIIAFEVKRPGTAPTPKDAAKLAAYSRLPSMRNTPRSAGCFLVDEKAAPAAGALSTGAAVLTWEAMRLLLLQAVEEQRDHLGAAGLVAAWIDRAFARYGMSAAQAPKSQGGSSGDYGTTASYRAIDALGLPPRVTGFLKGSEAVEAFWQSKEADPPMAWLHNAPSRRDLSVRRCQQTSDRQLNRWVPTWRAAMERAVP